MGVWLNLKSLIPYGFGTISGCRFNDNTTVVSETFVYKVSATVVYDLVRHLCTT